MTSIAGVPLLTGQIVTEGTALREHTGANPGNPVANAGGAGLRYAAGRDG